ncbi:MAG: hypothetical protein DCC58_07810 [Chloroflexi bacterium]|nr:MAG: hypothetical protein DCC58_07810 [Chloroflexota bacterium]
MVTVADRAPEDPGPLNDRIVETRAGLAAMSEFAVRSFATIEEAVEATLELMRRLLGMEVRMVNQIDGDQLTFRYLQLPPDFPNLQGMVTPLNHNF